MKIIVVLVLVIQSAVCFANSGMPCEKIEYAQLKDSSKKELNDHYCGAVSKNIFNDNVTAPTNDMFQIKLKQGVKTDDIQKEMLALGAAKSSCFGMMEDASRMLKKKFKSNPPKCE